MANGALHSMYITPEVIPGVTPNNPSWTPIRHTATTLALSKDTLQSQELRSDRQISDFRHGSYQIGGDISFEISYGSFDQILEAVTLGTWTPTTATTTVDISLANGILTRSTGDFITDGFSPGLAITLSGFTNAGNNGYFIIRDCTSTTLAVYPIRGQTMVTENAAGVTITGKGDTLKAGVQRRSFSIERFFGDIAPSENPYHRFTGVEFNTMSLQISANSMLTGSFAVLGQNMSVNAGTVPGATYNQSSTTTPLDSFTGSLSEAGTTIAVVTEIQLSLENGLEPRYVVGQKASIEPSIGRSNCSGSVTAYFEDSRLLDKFINEVESSITFELPDAAGNRYFFTMPRIKYGSGQPDVSGEGPITLNMNYQALLDAKSGTNILITRIPA